MANFIDEMMGERNKKKLRAGQIVPPVVLSAKEPKETGGGDDGGDGKGLRGGLAPLQGDARLRGGQVYDSSWNPDVVYRPQGYRVSENGIPGELIPSQPVQEPVAPNYGSEWNEAIVNRPRTTYEPKKTEPTKRGYEYKNQQEIAPYLAGMRATDYEEKSQPRTKDDIWNDYLAPRYRYINDIGGQRDATNKTGSSAFDLMVGAMGGPDVALARQGLGQAYANPYRIYDYMTKDEIGVLNYTLETKGEKEAKKYLKLLEATLNDRKAGEVTEAADELSEYPALASAVTVPLSVASAMEGAMTIADGLQGGLTASDPYRIATSFGARIRNNVSGEMTPTGAFFYNVGMSMLDTAFRLPMGQASLAVAGLGAASQTTQQMLEKGATSDQALMMGGIYGLIEVATEKMGLDNLLKTAASGTLGGILKNIFKQGGIEAGEEGAAEIADIVTDLLVMKDSSAWQQTMNEYGAQGYNEQQAFSKTLLDNLVQVGLSTLGGFMSGIFFGSGGQITDLSQAGKNAGYTGLSTLKQGAVAIESYNAAEKAYKQAMQATPQYTSKERMAITRDISRSGMSTEDKAAVQKIVDMFAMQPQGWITPQGAALTQAAIKTIAKQSTRGYVAGERMALERNAAKERLGNLFTQIQTITAEAETALASDNLVEYAAITDKLTRAMTEYEKQVAEEKTRTDIRNARAEDTTRTVTDAIKEAVAPLTADIEAEQMHHLAMAAAAERQAAEQKTVEDHNFVMSAVNSLSENDTRMLDDEQAASFAPSMSFTPQEAPYARAALRVADDAMGKIVKDIKGEHKRARINQEGLKDALDSVVLHLVNGDEAYIMPDERGDTQTYKALERAISNNVTIIHETLDGKQFENDAAERWELRERLRKTPIRYKHNTAQGMVYDVDPKIVKDRSLFGTIMFSNKISKKGVHPISVDQLFYDLRNEHPGIFTEDILNPDDQLLAIASFIRSTYGKDEVSISKKDSGELAYNIAHAMEYDLLAALVEPYTAIAQMRAENNQGGIDNAQSSGLQGGIEAGASQKPSGTEGARGPAEEGAGGAAAQVITDFKGINEYNARLEKERAGNETEVLQPDQSSNRGSIEQPAAGRRSDTGGQTAIGDSQSESNSIEKLRSGDIERAARITRALAVESGEVAAPFANINPLRLTGDALRTEHANVLEAITKSLNDDFHKAGVLNRDIAPGDLRMVESAQHEGMAGFFDTLRALTGEEVYIYESKSGRQDIPYGFALDGASYVRYTPEKIDQMVFHAAHENAHNMPAIVAAGMGVVNNMPQEVLEAYISSRTRDVVPMTKKAYKGELVSDMFGTFMYEVVTGNSGKANLIYERMGIPQQTVDDFMAAFTQAMGGAAYEDENTEAAAQNLQEAFAPNQAMYSETEALEMSEATDTTGRALTRQQAEFFANSALWEGDKLRVVYHGTGTTINEFLESFTGKGNDQLGSGFYFTTKKETAEGYTTRTLNEQPKPGGEDNPNVIEAYLNIQNPIIATGANLRDAIDGLTRAQVAKIIKLAPGVYDYDNTPLWDYVDISRVNKVTDAHINQAAEYYTDGNLLALENGFFRDDATAFRHALHDVLGYDGVMKVYSEEETHYIAWFPEQIKHVTNGAPTTSRDIRYSQMDIGIEKADENGIKIVPEFYSRIVRELENYPGKTVGLDIINYLKGRGVKDEEIKYSDLENFINKSENKRADKRFAINHAFMSIPKIKTGVVEGPYTGYDQYSLEEGRHDYKEMLFQIDRGIKVPFQSAHFRMPNIIGHVRFQTFEGLDPDTGAVEETLFIDEFQSDWHEKGRELGYLQPGDKDRATEYDVNQEAIRGYEELRKRAQTTRQADYVSVSRVTRVKDGKTSTIKQGHTGEGEQYYIIAAHKNNDAARDGIYEMLSDTGYMKTMLGDTLYNDAMDYFNQRDEGNGHSVPGLTKEYLDNIVEFHTNGADYFKVKTMGAAISQRILENDYSDFDPAAIDLSGKDAAARIKLGAPQEAPYSKTWHEYLVKRMLRYAVENKEHNYEFMAWATGKMNSDRYSLSAFISSIKARKIGKDSYDVLVFDKDGRTMYNLSDKHSADEMREKFGAALSRDLMDGADGYYDPAKAYYEQTMYEKRFDDGYELGGEGMRAFYDVGGKSSQNIPRYLSKYVKQWGSEVIQMEIIGDEGKYTVPAIRLTDALREAVLYEGQPLFSNNNPFGIGRDFVAPFYSRLEREVEGYPGKKINADIVNYLKGRGVKDEEIKWSGLVQFLERPAIKEDVLNFLRNSNTINYIRPMILDDPMYGRYSLERGDHLYREVLFQYDAPGYDEYSPHFQDKVNILAHARIQDFAHREGPVFFVDEFQSDWHEKGRERGYAKTEDVNELKRVAEQFDAINASLREYEFHEAEAARSSVWHKMTIAPKFFSTEHHGQLYEATGWEQYEKRKAIKTYAVTLWKNEDSEPIEMELVDFDLKGAIGITRLRAIDNKMREAYEETKPTNTGNELLDSMYLSTKTTITENNTEFLSERKQHAIEYLKTHQKPVMPPDLRNRMNDLADAVGDKVSEAPFSKTWHEFLSKAVINAAVTSNPNHYEYIAWATGRMQADRYSLARVLDRVSIIRITISDDYVLYGVRAYDKEGGRIATIPGHTLRENEIYEYFGRDLGRELISGATESESDDAIIDIADIGLGHLPPFNSPGWYTRKFENDEVIGGEGMRAFYDVGGKSSQNIPRFLDKYVKQWGSKVEFIQIHGRTGVYEVPAIRITKEMREAVETVGQPLFSSSDINLNDDSFIDEAMRFYKAGVTAEAYMTYPDHDKGVEKALRSLWDARRNVRILRTATDLYNKKVTPREYWWNNRDKFDGEKHQVQLQLIGMLLRNNVNVGGRIGAQSLDVLLQNADKFNQYSPARYSAMSPARVFENLPSYRKEKTAADRAANAKDGAQMRRVYQDYLMNQHAARAAYMKAWGDRVREAFANGTTQESNLIQLLGEDVIGIEDVAEAIFDNRHMYVPSAGGGFVFDGKGNLIAFSDFAITYYKRKVPVDKSDTFFNKMRTRGKTEFKVIDQPIRATRVGNGYKIEIPAFKEAITITNGRKVNAQKVQRVTELLRDFYATAWVDQSSVLVDNGYRPAGYVKNYFPHQKSLESGITAVIKQLVSYELPTAIAGETRFYKPGKPWANHLMARMGAVTEFDAMRGFNNYLRGAADVIYMTPAIQRLRQLEGYIRRNAGLLYPENYNNTLAVWLRQHTNGIANKKADIDRGVEDALGREAYGVMDALTNLISKSAILANISSALSNTISLIGALPTLTPKGAARGVSIGLVQAFLAEIDSERYDGFSDKIPFMRMRFDTYEPIITQKWKKFIRDGDRTLACLFAFMDRFTVEAVARAKYSELIERGISESEAAEQTSAYCLDLFADRNKGMSPTIFNSKMLKPFLQFQTEVLNQMSHFRDIRHLSSMEMVQALDGKTAEEAAAIDKKLIAGGAYREWRRKLMYLIFLSLWGAFTRLIMGRDQTWNPYGMIKDFARDAGKNGVARAAWNTAVASAEQLPFTSVLTGGRIPIASAFEKVGAVFEDIGAGVMDGEWDFDKMGYNALMAALTFVTGGGQLRKIITGADAVKEQGVYTKSGELRFPVSKEEAMKVILFGPYAAMPEGYDFKDKLSKFETAAYQEMVASGYDQGFVYQMLMNYNPATNATKALSLLTADINGDGRANNTAKDLTYMARVLGLSYDPEKDGAFEKWAREETETYKESKKDKKELTDKEQKNLAALDEMWALLGK